MSMGSRGLLRLTAARWGARPVSAAPGLTSLPSQRLSSTLRSNSTCLKGLPHCHSNRAWFFKGPARTAQHRITCASSIRPFSSRTTRSGSGSGTSPRQRLLYILALLSLTLPTIYELRKPDRRTTLNKDLFTPCTVISNVPVSPTAFLLTIQLPRVAANDAAVAAAWRHGLWSVEVKQPQLQIARNYTPLPALPGQAAGQLRLYVRRYDGGEVSTYLSRLGPGEPVEIRGPHCGFDLGARLGTDAGAGPRPEKKLVVLAGGTGVAPAMQAAEYALEREAVDVEVLWANRAGADCAGCARLPREKKGWFSSGSQAVDERHLKEEPSAIVRQIQELQAAYKQKGKKFEVKCAVDEEGSMVKAREIMDAVGKIGQVQVQSSLSCHFHSQQQLEYSTEESDVSDGAGEKGGVAARQCTCVGEGAKGKNLFIISGPDGFVSAFVGPKVWADGGERQGPVGGVISTLMREHPEIWKNWLILKQ